MDTKKNISLLEFSAFMKELEKEYYFHAKEGAGYRAQLADLSIQVARKAGDVIPFFDRKQAKQVVIDTFPEMPEDHVEDVGFMLHLVVKDLAGNGKSSIKQGPAEPDS